MPIYEYKCTCGNTFEKIVCLKDADLPQVCSCDKKEKVFRTPVNKKTSFSLKGNWFKTSGQY